MGSPFHASRLELGVVEELALRRPHAGVPGPDEVVDVPGREGLRIPLGLVLDAEEVRAVKAGEGAEPGGPLAYGLGLGPDVGPGDQVETLLPGPDAALERPPEPLLALRGGPEGLSLGERLRLRLARPVAVLAIVGVILVVWGRLDRGGRLGFGRRLLERDLAEGDEDRLALRPADGILAGELPELVDPQPPRSLEVRVLLLPALLEGRDLVLVDAEDDALAEHRREPRVEVVAEFVHEGDDDVLVGALPGLDLVRVGRVFRVADEAGVQVVDRADVALRELRRVQPVHLLGGEHEVDPLQPALEEHRLAGVLVALPLGLHHRLQPVVLRVRQGAFRGERPGRPHVVLEEAHVPLVRHVRDIDGMARDAQRRQAVEVLRRMEELGVHDERRVDLQRVARLPELVMVDDLPARPAGDDLHEVRARAPQGERRLLADPAGQDVTVAADEERGEALEDEGPPPFVLVRTAQDLEDGVVRSVLLVHRGGPLDPGRGPADVVHARIEGDAVLVSGLAESGVVGGGPEGGLPEAEEDDPGKGVVDARDGLSEPGKKVHDARLLMRGAFSLGL